MDDYNLSTLIESKNEWSARLINLLTPHVIEGIKSIFNEAYKLCVENDEENKYLMTFQNLLNNVPKWSQQTVDEERRRIETESQCNYLEDLLSCVHIVQLKALTTARAGTKQKKVNIDIPNMNIFIHKVYINVARKIYLNMYLFEKNIIPLQIQKNNRELEIIVKECILNTIRENIPIENLLRTYLDETQETEIEVEEKKETIIDEKALEIQKEQKRKKEIEEAKMKLKMEIEREASKKVNNAIINANKLLNDNDLIREEIENNENNILNDKIVDNDKLVNNDKIVDDDKINIKDEIINTDLQIKNLDSLDPDKFDINSLEIELDNIKEEDNKLENNIELDIEELV